jgi:hypothetical protein
MVITAGFFDNKNANVAANVLTGGMSGQAAGIYGTATGKKDPWNLQGLSDLDPTKVRKANTSQTQGLINEASTQAGQFFNKPVERFQPTQITTRNIRAGAVTPMQAQAAQIEEAAGRTDFLNALAASQARMGQAGQIDPRMQQYLEQSLRQGATTQDALGMLQAAAMGNAPSQAQAVMQAGTDQAIRAQMAMGASGGFNPANLRGAQSQGALLQQQAINQGAQLRAQEMAQARQTYGQLGLSADQAQQQMFAQAAQQQLAASQFQEQAKQQALNAYLQGTQNLYGMDQTTALQQAQFAQQAGLANQAATNQASMFNVGNTLAANQFNAQQALQAQQLNNQFGQNALNSYLAAQQGYAGLGAQMFGQALGGQQGLTALEQQRLNQQGQLRNQMFGAGASAAGSAGAAAIAASDRNMKKNIRVNKETQAFLNALTDNAYEYKDASLPGTQSGTNYGPMAQDLEKTKMGKTAVRETANGKLVDSARGFLLALSGLANLNQRINALESK